jgi:hypothetical protein
MHFWRRYRPARAAKPASPFRPRPELLENRCLPSTLTVTNNSDTGFFGDGSLRGLVVDQLTRKVRLRHPAGRTLHAAPLGSPYVLVSLNNNMLGTGATQTVVLTFGDPLGRKIHYNLRVLDGSGQP